MMLQAPQDAPLALVVMLALCSTPAPLPGRHWGDTASAATAHTAALSQRRGEGEVRVRMERLIQSKRRISAGVMPSQMLHISHMPYTAPVLTPLAVLSPRRILSSPLPLFLQFYHHCVVHSYSCFCRIRPCCWCGCCPTRPLRPPFPRHICCRICISSI